VSVCGCWCRGLNVECRMSIFEWKKEGKEEEEEKEGMEEKGKMEGKWWESRDIIYVAEREDMRERGRKRVVSRR